MEYVQMTLDEWMEIKQKLRQELLGVKQSFVRIGYMLRQIDDQKGYERDGYKSIAEFAKKELGLHPSTTTRFMEINREYSIDGYTKRLRPEYSDLGRSQLEEMLKLPDSDRTMIQPEASRESIRDLKRFNHAGPAEGADDMTELLIKFYKDNPDALNGIFSGNLEAENIGRVKELVNPSGNRSYKKGLFFLMFYENKIVIKKFGQTPQDMTWEEFLDRTWDIFKGTAAGENTWNNYFGGEEDGTGTDMEDGKENERDTTETAVENHGGTDITHTHDDEREKVSKESGESVPGRNKKSKEAIAPAQKSRQIRTEEEQSENENEPEENANESADNGERQGESNEPEKNISETESGMEEAGISEETTIITDAQQENTEIEEMVDKPFGTRKEYMDTLTEHGMANYMADEYKNHNLKVTSLAFPEELERWLKEKVDFMGRTWE